MKGKSMSTLCYLIEAPDGTCLHLSEEGPRHEPPPFLEKLKRRGFRHREDRPLGDYVLHVYRKDMPATDIVPSDEEAESLA